MYALVTWEGKSPFRERKIEENSPMAESLSEEFVRVSVRPELGAVSIACTNDWPNEKFVQSASGVWERISGKEWSQSLVLYAGRVVLNIRGSTLTVQVVL